MDKLLVFDIWGDYAHFKKIYATTSAVSYTIPPKTSMYGYIGAILGLKKQHNDYLNSFKEGDCRIALQIVSPLVMQRINTNLRSVLGRMKANGNRKPTMVEYVYKPHYRIFFQHKDDDLYESLKSHLKEHKAVYTPTLGLANLISNFEFIGEFNFTTELNSNLAIQTVIPKSKFVRFDIAASFKNNNEIVELSQYAVEMDIERNVTKRDDILLDRKGHPIQAEVLESQQVNINDQNLNLVLF